MAHTRDKQSNELLRNDVQVDYSFDTTGSQALLDALGTSLSPEMLVHALTHRSFAHENPGLPNNERLEFLGDAVLELVVTETIYSQYPDWPEGHLAPLRAKVVSQDSLAAIGREKLHVGHYILLGKGEMENGGADKPSILCDTVEALIGAVFLEHGIDGARPIIHRLIDDTLAHVAQLGPALDWKTALVVACHGKNLEDPTYRMKVSGDLTSPVYTAHVVMADGSEIATAQASSKKKAQMKAAHIAYQIVTGEVSSQKSAEQREENRETTQAAEGMMSTDNLEPNIGSKPVVRATDSSDPALLHQVQKIEREIEEGAPQAKRKKKWYY